MTSYLAEIGRVAILSKDQQLLHCKRIRQWLDWPDGRDAAPPGIRRAGKRSMDRMVESNLRMVVSIAKKYSGQGVPLEDLIQEGNLGLVTACEKFDPERGYCFSTFSYWWIRQGMTRCLANSSRLIRIPCNTSELVRKLRRVQMQWQGIHGRLPTHEELAEELDQPVNRIKIALEAAAMQPRSLDQLINDEGSPLGDLIAADNGPDLDQQLERQLEEDRLISALPLLPDLERLTLEGIIHDRLSQREIGERLQLSSTRVGQLQRKAVSRLRCMLRQQSTSVASHPAADHTPEPETVIVTLAVEQPLLPGLEQRYENVPLPV